MKNSAVKPTKAIAKKSGNKKSTTELTLEQITAAVMIEVRKEIEKPKIITFTIDPARAQMVVNDMLENSRKAYEKVLAEG